VVQTELDSNLSNTKNKESRGSGMKDTKPVKLVGRPSVPDCEKKQRITVTIHWELMEWLRQKRKESWGEMFVISHFVEDAILEKILRTDPLFDARGLTFIDS